MRFLALPAGVLAVVLVASCGDQALAPRTVAGPTPTPTATGVCDALLPEKAVEDLAGQALHAPRFSSVKALGEVEVCEWVARFDSRAGVSAARIPASDWVSVLPVVVDTLLESDMEFPGRERLRSSLALIRSEKDFDDREACVLFTTLAVATGEGTAGATETLVYFPTYEEPTSIIFQQCRDERFTSLQLIGRDLVAGEEIEGRLIDAVLQTENSLPVTS